MKPDYESVLEQALKLTDRERAQLIDVLGLSFSEEYLAEVEQAWLEEAQARADQIDRDKAELIPDAEVRKKTSRLLDEEDSG